MLGRGKYKRTEEGLRKMVETRNRKGSFNAWNKGKTNIYSEDTKEKMRLFRLGKKQSKVTITKRTLGNFSKFLKKHDIKKEDVKVWPKFRNYRYGAKQRGLNFDITFEEFKSFWQKECKYCGEVVTTLGLDRIDNNKGYEVTNVVSCCSLCNYMKREFTIDIFIEQCKKIANNHAKSL